MNTGKPTSEQTAKNRELQSKFNLREPIQTRSYDGETLICFDPGVVCTGVAVISRGSLIDCSLMPREHKVTMPQRIEQLGNQVRMFYLQYRYLSYCRCIVEYPQIYATRIRQGTTKENPNYLLDVSAMCGVIISIMSESFNCEFVRPAEWKGQVDADVMTKRILLKLTNDELKLVPRNHLAHNGIDAIGIGLKISGRL